VDVLQATTDEWIHHGVNLETDEIIIKVQGPRHGCSMSGVANASEWMSISGDPWVNVGAGWPESNVDSGLARLRGEVLGHKLTSYDRLESVRLWEELG
jgi:hypothetical protein